MPASATGVAWVGRLIGKYYDRVLLDNLYPDLYLYQFGDKKSLPESVGTTIYFNRFTKVATAHALNESAIIGASGISAAYVSATVAGHGVAVKHNDLFIASAVSDVIEASVRECAKSIALAVDNKIKATLSGLTGSNFVGASANAVHSVATTDALIIKDLVKSKMKLDNADCKPFSDGYLAGVFHPRAIYDLQTDSTTGGWIDANKYANPENIYKGEVGRAYGIRVCMSSNMKQIIATGGMSTKGSGYQGFVIGQGAYGVVELNNHSAKTFVKQLGSGGSYDPINQLATVGAKIYFAVAQLDVTNRLSLIASGGVV